jgi:hypothetical protein
MGCMGQGKGRGQGVTFSIAELAAMMGKETADNFSWVTNARRVKYEKDFAKDLQPQDGTDPGVAALEQGGGAPELLQDRDEGDDPA